MTFDEWQAEPQLVMGAIMGCINNGANFSILQNIQPPK